MNHPLLAPTKRTFIGGIVILAVVLGGFFVWRRGQTPDLKEAVAAFLDRTVGGGRVRFSVVRIGIVRPGDADLQLSVAATARTLLPLYSRIDATDYLRRTFQLDPGSMAEARRLLADKRFSQNPEFTGAGPFPADPYQAAVLQMKSPADASFHYQGVINAHRDGATWVFAPISGGFEGSSPQGEARSAFGDASFVAGDAGDDARLHGLATDLQAFAGRVAEVRRNLESAHAALVDGRKKAFLAQIAPGRVFRGRALEAGEQQGTPLYLEIAGLSPENEVAALLRNDGGWHYARAFKGTWSADDEFESPTLNLTSLPDQALRNAGPFLENTQTWTFALRMNPHGGLSEKNRLFQYEFQPLPQEQASALRSRLNAEFQGAISATEPGSLYRGTAYSRTSGKSEPILLRFTGRSEGGEAVDAALESTIRSWKRPLHGTIIANARRSGGEPVRLRSGSSEAVEDAPAESVLGDRDDMDFSLGAKDGSLVGGGGQFTYRLAAAGEAERHRLEADRAEWVRRVMGILRDGIVYDGVLRETQGFVTGARIEIAHIDRQTGAISARINSRVKFNVYRDFSGTCDPSGGSLVLAATSRGAFDPSGSFNIPFLRVAAATTLHLVVTGNLITGRIEGDPHWTMEFSAGAFLSALTESSEPNSPPSDGSVFPPFPKKAGAYLLNRGGWTSLPRNQGHVVVETIRLPTDEEIPASITDAVSEGLAQFASEGRKLKVSHLEFAGKDPRPVSRGPAMILLFVGPELPDRPPVELAPAETLKDGRRRVVILCDSPTRIRFGEQRLAAYVREVASGSILLTTTVAPAPGAYVFNADAGYELVQE